MLSRACAVLLITVSFCAAQSSNSQKAEGKPNIQTGYCPQTHELEAEPSQRFFLDGTIGKRAVRMFLDRGGSGIVGLFYYSEGDWTPTVLGGSWNEGGNVEMTDGTESRPASGRLQGELTDGHFTGTWQSLSSGSFEAVKLSTIQKPECDGKGPWKRFDDPKWPISFAYPANWLLHVSPGSIALICPNPEEIASRTQVDIYEGQGAPDGPTQLFQCGKGWKFGDDCGCEYGNDLRCQPAKVHHKEHETILDVSDREWRYYCRDGGYVAEGDGVDRIVLLQDSWLEVVSQIGTSGIIDRLIGTLRPHAPSSSK